MTDANEALAAVLENLSTSVSESNARITFDQLPTLPIRSTHLQQLFQNLVGNAIKYRSPDRPPLIHLAAMRSAREWTFTVTDNGIGIAPEYKENVFGLSNGCTPVRNIPEQESDWPFVNESWISTMGGSGSNPNPDEDLTF